MWVQSLFWEEDLEKETTTHFSILTWEIPGTEEPGGSLVQSVTGGVGGAPFFPWIIREHLMEVEETPGWGEPSLCKGNSKCAFSPSFLASGLL